VTELYQDGKYREAIPLAERFAETIKARRGPAHPEYATSLNNLAHLYRSQGRYADAERLWNRAINILEIALGPDHRQIAESVNGLAALYYNQGRYSEAERLYRRALAITEKALGPNHSDVGTILNNLALLYSDQGRYADAEPLYKRSLLIREKALGPNHRNLIQSLNNLAELQREQGRTAEAEPLYTRALAIAEKVLHPGHPDLGTSLNNLALLYIDQGRYADAEPLLKRALAITEGALGADHPNVASSFTNLAVIYRAQGRYAEAESLLKRALAVREKVFGPDHPIVGAGLSNLAGISEEQGDSDAALGYQRRATAICIKRVQLGGAFAKSELSQCADDFRMHVLIAQHANDAGSTTLPESLEMAQWALQSGAADALAQMSVRFAASTEGMAAAIRERQDLVRRAEAADARLIEAATDADPRAAEIARGDMVSIEARIAALDQRLAGEFPNYAQLASPKPLDIAAVQALLQPDEVLLLFLDVWGTRKLPEAMYAWGVTKTDARWVKLSLMPSQVATTVAALRCGVDPTSWEDPQGRRRCRELVGAQPDKDGALPFDLTKAHELYEALLDPFLDEVRGKRLLIVAPDPLANLPFGLLVTERPAERLPKTVEGYRSAKWLGTETAISILPSVASLNALRRLTKSSQAPEPFIGFGDPVLRGNASCRAPVLPAACPAAPGTDQRVASLPGSITTRSVTRTPLQRFFNGGLANLDILQGQCPLPDTSFELTQQSVI
jgi:tetratricopeptide (TPR) repeat protein